VAPKVASSPRGSHAAPLAGNPVQSLPLAAQYRKPEKKIPNASIPNAFIFRYLILAAEIYLQWKQLITKELRRESYG
jgi:hypothetical protein